MPSRRQLRAGKANNTASLVPEHIARFRLEDWPPTAAEPDIITGGPGAANYCGRRRWYNAQQKFADDHGMTIHELWRLIASLSG